MKRDLFVADTDVDTLRFISHLFSKRGWSVRTFGDAELLLSAIADHSPSCIVVDLHLQGRSALDVFGDLREIGFKKPILVMSGTKKISVAVDAMKRGAANFIQKPVDEAFIVEAVTEAVNDWDGKQPASKQDFSLNLESYPFLTRREADVLRCIATGETSKASASSLNISRRTVEFYRARLLKKLGAKNSADLVRIVME